MRTMKTILLIVLGIALAAVALLIGLMIWLGPIAGASVGLVAAAAIVVAYVTLVGPWQRQWGATGDEVRRVMPGDDLLRPGAATTTRAVSIHAAPDRVFPWLLQIGYGRGGWYSYDRIDNDGRPSVAHIDPQLQRLAPGDRLEMMPGMGPIVHEIVPGHHIVSAGEADSWCLLVEAAPDGTRLISRWRQDWPRTILTYVWVALADPGAFVMEQKMLRTIRDLAEGAADDVTLTVAG